MHLHWERSHNTAGDCNIRSLSWMGRVPDELPTVRFKILISKMQCFHEKFIVIWGECAFPGVEDEVLKVWKNEKFSFTQKIFREINSLATFTKFLWKKCEREFPQFLHTLVLILTKTLKIACCCEFDLTENFVKLNFPTFFSLKLLSRKKSWNVFCCTTTFLEIDFTEKFVKLNFTTFLKVELFSRKN